MKMLAINRRSVVLLLLLGASIVAAVAVSREPSGKGVVAVSERGASPRVAAATASVERPLFETAESDQVAQLNSRRIEDKLDPLFSATHQPEAPPPMVQSVPMEPVMPPLPFRVIGQMIEDGKLTVFLSINDRSIAVKAGETIDDTYRVESIANGVAEFMYLPMRQKQTLSIGEKL